MKKLILILGGLFILSCGRLATPTPKMSHLPSSLTPTPSATATAPATATPRQATPRATATPTPTPTPVIYTVQSGDTLLKIAIQFDRSLETLQEANGIVDPRFLQIGQQIIIPPPETNPDDPPTPTATPPPLIVESINFQHTEPGGLWCLGQVSNPGTELITEVVIEAALFDAGGVLLARSAAFTQLDVVPPDQPIPFAIQFDSPPGDFAQYQVAPVSGLPLSDQARYYFELEPFDLHGSPVDIATYRLRGQLRNRGQTDAEAIRLVAIAYDAEGRVLAQRQAELTVSLLKAGAATPFEIDLIIPHGLVDHYEVVAQALQAP